MSVSLETLERIKAQLKQARDQGSTVKLDLYTHLTEVFNRIMLHHPYDAYDKFEEFRTSLSRLILRSKTQNLTSRSTPFSINRQTLKRRHGSRSARLFSKR
jgi:hypothetical protein